MSSKRKARRRTIKNNFLTRSKIESKLLLLPIIFIVTILPLITHFHTYKAGLSTFDWFSKTDEYDDVFLFYKQWFFVFVSAVILSIICIRAYKNKKSFPFAPIFIPLGVYALLALLSTIFSKYQRFGFTGIYAQFENVFCLLGYVLVVYYIFLIVKSEYEVKLLIDALAVGALILCTLGTFQALGYDFLLTKAGQTILGANVKLEFGKGRTYATLYNPNYVGVYTSFIIPIFSILLLHAKKLYQYVLYSLVITTAVISLFGSQSKAGFVSILTAAVFTVILLRQKLIKVWYLVIPMMIAIIGSFIFVNKLNDNAYINAIKSAFSITKSDTPNLQSITTDRKGVHVNYKGNEFYVTLSLDDEYVYINAFDSNDAPIQTSIEESGITYSFNDTRFPGISMAPVIIDKSYGFGLKIDNNDWYFTNQTDDGSYKYLNLYKKLVPIESIEHPFLQGYESLASNRGYIWSRTFSILSKYIFLGSGADTFSIVFPQYDYVGLYNFGYQMELITKPHCLYLQVATQTGVLSLFALFTFYLMYFINSIRLFIKKRTDSPLYSIGIAIFIGTISYMVSAISNDSSITVAPSFWVVIGIGIAVNQQILKLSNTNLITIVNSK